MHASTLPLLLLGALLLVAVSASNSQTEVDGDRCGFAFDGLAYGTYDLRKQTSLSTLAAHWDGFSDDVLMYEYAVITEKYLPYLQEKSGHCGVFTTEPDVIQWTNVRNANSIALNSLKLEVGETYHFLVRATYRSGRQGVVATDGVQVVEREESEHVGSEHHREARGIRVERATASVEAHVSTGDCPIDAENRCSASRVSVGEFLQETYGDPVFNRASDYDLQILIGTDAARARAGIYPDNAATRNGPKDFEGIGLLVATEDFARYEDSDGDDDNDGGGGLGKGEAPLWALAPLLAFVLILCIIAVILVVLRVALRGETDYSSGGQSSSYGSSLAASEVDESKDYSQRKGANVGAANDRTEVHYPDTQIRRLSITHNEGEEGDLLEEATKSPRRKHPIMSTQSSSTRNYEDDA